MPPLDFIGEVHCNVTRGHLSFQLEALVVKQLDVDILAGNPFLVRSDIAVHPYKKQIIIGDADIVHYGTEGGKTSKSSERRTQAFLLRNHQKTFVLPEHYYTHLATLTPIQCELSKLGWTVVLTCGVSQSEHGLLPKRSSPSMECYVSLMIPGSLFWLAVASTSAMHVRLSPSVLLWTLTSAQLVLGMSSNTRVLEYPCTCVLKYNKHRTWTCTYTCHFPLSAVLGLVLVLDRQSTWTWQVLSQVLFCFRSIFGSVSRIGKMATVSMTLCLLLCVFFLTKRHDMKHKLCKQIVAMKMTVYYCYFAQSIMT